MSDIVATVKRTGRIPKSDQQAIVDRILVAMLNGETRHSKLALAGGVGRKHVAKYIERARQDLAIETELTPATARTKLASRFDHLYREALDGFARAKQSGDRKSEIGYLTVANQVVANEAKVRGVDSLPAAVGAQPSSRVIFESFEAPPAAALVAAARVLAASGTGTLPLQAGAVSDTGKRGALGERLVRDSGVVASGNLLGERETE